MQGKVTVAKSLAVLLAVCLSVSMAHASSYGTEGSTSLNNPWGPTNFAISKVMDRSLSAMGDRLPHAAALDGFSSWTMFVDYDFGKNKDKRQGGFDNYFNSYTVGADTFYGDTLWGFMGNFNEAQGGDGAGTRSYIDTWAYTLYMSRPINDWMFWGSSLTYATAENKIKGVRGTTDSDSWVLAPYLTMMTRMDNVTLSLSPSYILGYQDVDYPAGGGDDTSLIGRMAVTGRASYAFDAQWSLSGTMTFNQILHNHALDAENDTDHQWFTTGVRLGYRVDENLSCSLGYSTEFDSHYRSRIWNIGLAYAF